MTAKELPQLQAVNPGRKPYTLSLHWRDGGRDTVDLTGLIFRDGFFSRLRDAAVFRTVTLLDHGWVIGWNTGQGRAGDELDYPSDDLKRLAEVQKPMTGAALRRWKKTVNLSNAEAAQVLGIAASTFKDYLNRRHVPHVVKIACQAMAADPVILSGLVRPRKPGRPRKVA